MAASAAAQLRTLVDRVARYLDEDDAFCAAVPMLLGDPSAEPCVTLTVTVDGHTDRSITLGDLWEDATSTQQWELPKGCKERRIIIVVTKESALINGVQVVLPSPMGDDGEPVDDDDATLPRWGDNWEPLKLFRNAGLKIHSVQVLYGTVDNKHAFCNGSDDADYAAFLSGSDTMKLA